MTRVLVADDHAIVRQGLCRLLMTAPDLDLAGEASCGREVLEWLRRGGVDLILLDMNMPDPSGVELIRRIRKTSPAVRIMVLSMHDDIQTIVRAIKAGASGYLTKESEPDAIVAAMRRISRGGNAISPELAERLLFDLTESCDGGAPGTLSDREYQVFLRLANGGTVGEIAAMLHLSPKTVSTHKTRIMRKLGLESNADIVRFAMRHGLIDR